MQEHMHPLGDVKTLYVLWVRGCLGVSSGLDVGVGRACGRVEAGQWGRVCVHQGEGGKAGGRSGMTQCQHEACDFLLWLREPSVVWAGLSWQRGAGAASDGMGEGLGVGASELPQGCL